MRRPSRRRKRDAPEAGAFRPAVPSDVQDVVSLYAAAARVCCARPDGIEDVTRELSRLRVRLMPPESVMADECSRLWIFFARAAQAQKPSLLAEAGRALYRDLESLGHRMELAPLTPWERLPVGIDDPHWDADADTAVTSGSDLAEVRQSIGDKRASLPAGARLPAAEVAGMVGRLDQECMADMLRRAVGEGVLGRAEGSMLGFFLTKKKALTSEDEALIDVLDKLGDWLSKP